MLSLLVELGAAHPGDIFVYPEPSNYLPEIPVATDFILSESIRNASMIVDCILGVGLTKTPHGNVAKLISAIMDEVEITPTAIVSVDLPSGVSGTTGEVFSPCIRADSTISIQAVKRGIMQYPAKANAGVVESLDIGIPTPPSGCRYYVLNPNDFEVPKRDPDAHKTNFGKVLVVGGSDHMTGAPILSALGALRSGAGFVYMAHGGCTPHRELPLEIMTKPFAVKNGAFVSPGIDALRSMIAPMSVVILGPGLSACLQTATLVLDILKVTKELSVPVVLDADGLRCLSLLTPTEITGCTDHCIITPHPGEAGGLLKKTAQDIQRDRYEAAENLLKQFGGTVVLKGANTIVLNSQCGDVNQIGNPMLATAGSGDVLTGIIGALVAQGLTNFDAASMGVYLHALAADILFSESGGPLIASDLCTVMPECFGMVWNDESLHEKYENE